MTRETVVGLICGALAMTSCGSDGKEDCTAGCQKMIECGKNTTLEQCVAACTQDPGNHALARCFAGVPGCDEASAEACADNIETTCTQAMKKIAACMEANGSLNSPKYAGWCNDEAKFVTATGGTKTIPFQSWSTTYLACTIDPKTCHCPGQTWYTDL